MKRDGSWSICPVSVLHKQRKTLSLMGPKLIKVTLKIVEVARQNAIVYRGITVYEFGKCWLGSKT